MRCQCGGRSEVGEVVRKEEEDGLLLPSSPHGSSTLILTFGPSGPHRSFEPS